MTVGDETLDSGVAQQRFGKRERDGVVGAENFDHRHPRQENRAPARLLRQAASCGACKTVQLSHLPRKHRRPQAFRRVRLAVLAAGRAKH